MVYTPISADFAYTYPGVPDSGNVSFSILNRTNSHPGTMVFIDDLSFDGFTSDITKINELHNHSAGLEVYPNPASGRVNILTGYQGENNISVYDLQGELVFRGVFYGGQFIFDCGNLSSGVYVVRILNGNYISTEKMVIAK